MRVNSIANLVVTVAAVSIMEMMNAQDIPSISVETPRLYDALGDAGGNLSKLDIEGLRTLLANSKAKLIGSAHDKLKFMALQEFCYLVKNRPDKAGILNDLVSLIKATPAPINDQPKDWDKIAMILRGGSVGLLMECALDIGGEKAFETIFTECIRVDDSAKLKALLNQVVFRNEVDKYKPLLRTKVKSLEIQKEVIERFIEK